MADCPHGDDPTLCPPCQRPPKGKRVRGGGIGPRFTARYRTDCPGCPVEIEPGDDVRVWDRTTWHARCAEVRG